MNRSAEIVEASVRSFGLCFRRMLKTFGVWRIVPRMQTFEGAFLLRISFGLASASPCIAVKDRADAKAVGFALMFLASWASEELLPTDATTTEGPIRASCARKQKQ